MSQKRQSRPKSKHQQKRQLFAKFKWRYLAFLLLPIIAFQIFYPSNRAPANFKIAGENHGWQTTDELTKRIQDQFDASSARIEAGDSNHETKLSALGASIDAAEMAKNLTKYSWWQRLIPLSFWWAGGSLESFQPNFSDDNLNQAATEIAVKLNSEPKSGSISIDDQGQIAIENAKDGVKISDDDITSSLKQTKFQIGRATTVKVKAEIVKPDIDDAVLQKTKANLLEMSRVGIKFTNSLTRAVSAPDDKEILSWLKLDGLEIGYNENAMRDYLNQIAKESIIVPGTTKVVTVDDKETSRTSGEKGRAVDSDPIVSQIESSLKDKIAKNITLNFKEVSPTIVYERKYSSSQKALQAYVDSVTSDGKIQISVKQLSGQSLSASSRAADSVVSASTYKLFIALILFQKINAGEINWSDSMQGADVKTCLEKMIVVSANNCAEEWVKQKWGRNSINSTLYGMGFSRSTNFAASDATHTSAADLQKLLIGLHSKSLFNSDDANRLIALMKKQVYRQGIPAGSSGVVADKVGFLWNYLNDAAIVYHPKGTYVLVIMTKDKSWAKIAEITRKIESIMYP